MSASIHAFLPPQQFRPLRDTLEAGVQEAYDAALAGLLGFQRRIALPGRVGPETANHLMNCLKGDVPELFCLRGLVLRRSMGPTRQTWMEPSYRLDPASVETLLREMGQATAPVLAAARTLDGPQKVKLLHDWLVRRFAYTDTGNPSEYEAPGALVYGKCVCLGVARAFKYLCDRSGIACIVVSGMATDRRVGRTGPVGKSERHAWNIVDFSSATQQESPAGPAAPLWRHIDATYDAGLSTCVVRYDYFGLSDAQIAVDHQLEGASCPACPTSSDWYRAAGLFADSRSQLGRIVGNALRNRQQAAVFQTPPLSDSRQMEETIPGIIAQEADKHGRDRRTIALDCNPERCVYQVSLL